MNKKFNFSFGLIIAILLLFPFHMTAGTVDSEYLKNFPEGSTPQEIGDRLAYHFVVSKHALYTGKWIGYFEVITWNGALDFATQMNDTRLISLLTDRFHFLFGSEEKLLPPKNHVDLNMFGSLPLKLYLIHGDKKYLDLGMPYADTQWELPENASEAQRKLANDGYTWETRLWIDDMYMIPIVQTMAYRVTKDQKYLDRAAKEMVMYLDSIQRPNGLFYHAPDVPYYWGRGNGWMAAGMTEVLRLLPEKSPYYKPIMKGYKKMMAALKKYQNEEGLWNQLVDKTDIWTETSGSAMFTYAFIEGIRHGWLADKEYGPLARKAWVALTHYINADNDVTSICIGTNKKNDLKYYYDRPKVTGDYHGQGPYLWCAAALLGCD
ncbi:MAG TPA: glycosyl hydrolase [Prevotella sp.]|nr:glycosyl hydrolase [Prevotella sp.]